MSTYTGIIAVSRNLKEWCCGITGVARTQKEVWVGVNGTSRKIFSSKKYLTINLTNNTISQYWAKNGISVFQYTPPSVPSRINGTGQYEKGGFVGIHLYGMNYWYLFINGAMDDQGIAQANGVVVARRFDLSIDVINITIENNGTYATVYITY